MIGELADPVDHGLDDLPAVFRGRLVCVGVLREPAQRAGRGSMCINTGGEKVYPEEVERALTAHPAVMDALVAGIPDERFGERVAAVVSLRPGTAAGTDALREHCRGTLAGYKVPARIRFVTEVRRSPSGKADYRWARAVLAKPGPAPSGPP